MRRVFALAHEGNGVHAIAVKLNSEKVPVLGRKTITSRHEKERARLEGREPKVKRVVWNETVVYHLLTSRTVLGEYQPCRGRGSERVERGEPIANYYPAVIDPGVWHAVHAGLGRRRKAGGEKEHIGKGRRGKHINLFAGLLVDARDGGSLTYKHLGNRPATLIPVGAKQGHGTKWASYPARPFELAILEQLSEVKVKDIEGNNDANQRVSNLSGKKAELENLIALWTSKMDNPNTVDIVAAKLSDLKTQLRTVAGQLADAQREAASPLSESWGEFLALAGQLAKDESDERRVKGRASLRRSIESITCLFVGGRVRIAAVRVQFRVEGDSHRDYIVTYDPGRSNHHVKRPGTHSARTFAEAGIPDGLDLRKPDHAALVEKTLTSLDTATMPTTTTEEDHGADDKPAKRTARRTVSRRL